MANQSHVAGQIAGIDNETDPQKKLVAALQILEQHDPNILDNLCMMAKLVVQDKDMYNLAVKKLKAALA